MATEVRNISTSTDTLKKDPRGKSPRRAATGPTIDEEGNVLPYPGFNAKSSNSYGCWTSPIARLAAAASFDKPIPTAGEYGIEVSKEPELDIPPECFLYEEERPWQLGKLNKAALDFAEPAAPIKLSKQVLDYLDALEYAGIQVINAVNASKAVEGDGEAPSLDTDALYEKEKAKAIAALPTYAKEVQTEEAPEPKIEAKIEAAEVKTEAPEPAKEAVKKPTKPKSRNASSSPANKGAKKPITGKAPNAPASSSAPRVQAQGSPRTSTQQFKPRTPGKSPGRGDAPPSKLATTSPRSSTAPKKVANAK